MNLLQVKEDTNYTDIKVVQEECKKVSRICAENNWKVLDVSLNPIEENSSNNNEGIL